MRTTMIAATAVAVTVVSAAGWAAAADAAPKGSSGSKLTVVSGDVLREKTQGLVHQLREQALDADGDSVGRIRWNCANGADWHCTVVYTLRGKGTLVATGIFAGFNGEALAITGGTGAFAAARGQVVLTADADAFTHQIELVQ